MTAPTNDTTILDALNALVATVTAAVAGTDVQVIYGPPLNTENDFVAFGYTGDASEPAVAFDFDVADAALGRDGEVYDVACVLSSWRGDATFADVDVEAFALLRTVRAAIAADRKLGGAIAQATVTSGEVVEEVDNGAVTTIRFLVHCKAWSR